MSLISAPHKTIRLAFFKYFIIPCALLMALVPHSSLAQTVQSPVQDFDERVLINLAKQRTPGQTKFFRFMSNTNNYVDIGVPVALMAGGLIANDKPMRQNAVYIATSSAVTALVTTAIKRLVKRPRPFVRNLKIISIYNPESYSFPSGHTSSSFATANALSYAYPKWYVIAPSFLWASSVSYSRMYLGVHYPTDVATGLLIGTGTPYAFKFMRP